MGWRRFAPFPGFNDLFQSIEITFALLFGAAQELAMASQLASNGDTAFTPRWFPGLRRGSNRSTLIAPLQRSSDA